MAEFDPLFPDEGEWAPVNPRPIPPVLTSQIPAGAVTNDKLGENLDPRKLRGVGIKVYMNGATQTITTGATGETITFDTVLYNQGFVDPGASFDTVAAPYAGVYLITANVEWENLDTAGRSVNLLINNVEKEGDRKKANNTSRVTVATVRLLSEGDTVGLHVEHDVGANTFVQNGEDSCALSVTFLFSF